LYLINNRTAAGALVSGWICLDHLEMTLGRVPATRPPIFTVSTPHSGYASNNLQPN
jgi:hypothetical protein